MFCSARTMTGSESSKNGWPLPVHLRHVHARVQESPRLPGISAAGFVWVVWPGDSGGDKKATRSCQAHHVQGTTQTRAAKLEVVQKCSTPGDNLKTSCQPKPDKLEKSCDPVLGVRVYHSHVAGFGHIYAYTKNLTARPTRRGPARSLRSELPLIAACPR